MSATEDRAAKKILEKAIERGLVTSGDVLETMRRHGASPARGLIDLLAEVSGADRATLEALDDRSLIGRTLGGFRIESKLGEGGMGAVYRATQASLGRAVALKVLDPSLACRPGTAERFRREARAAARLDHENVVQPIDFGEEAGFLFFAMELMDGGSAVSRVLEKGPCAEAEALEIGIAVARALEYAEERGLVHRDVKPDNILFSRQGTPKLGDLGLVLERGDEAKITEPGRLIGTLHYMAPEQARGGRDLDVRTDIYALGVTLYELCCGAPPFEGSAVTILFQHVAEPVPDVRIRAPHVSGRLAGIIARMTAKEREARYPGARALREALEEAARALAAGAPDEEAPAPPAPPGASEPAAAPASAPGAPPGRRRRPAPLVAAAVLAIAAAGALAAVMRAGGSAKAPVGGADAAPSPAIDPAAEAAAAGRLRDLILARCEGADPTPGILVGTDPWTTAQALAALSLARPEPDEALIERLRAYLRRTRLAGPDGAPAGWGVVETDSAAATEVTGWVGVAFALAGRGEAGAHDRDGARRAILAAQQADGGFASVPAGGPATVRASATAVALAGLVLIEAAERRPAGADTGERRPGTGERQRSRSDRVGSERVGRAIEAIDAIERAAAWLGRHYDRAAHAWFPNPRPMFGNREPVHGLSEFAAYWLLEAEALLDRRGRAPPGEAREAVADFAARFRPSELPITATGLSYLNDYLFELKPGASSSLRAPRWIWGAWRPLAARRIAGAAPPLPRAEEWAREASRLRARFPELAAALGEAPTFQVCEVLFAASGARARAHDASIVAPLLAGERGE